MTESIPAGLRHAAAEVDRALTAHLESAAVPDNLAGAIRYSVLGGGKRLRPALALLSSEACGGDRRAALPAAMALELVHCFSLVHDDLPAMDDDDTRRGRPSLHVHAGEAMAILAGDAMMSMAFGLVAAGADGDTGGRLVRELAEAATAMIAGQVYDTLGGFPDGMPDRERLQLTHRHKTAALLRASCRMGGIAAGAASAELDGLTRFGEAVGLMFQIIDDLLDVTQSSEHLGKAAGKDHLAGKLTFPGLVGVERSRAEVERLRHAARDAVAPLGEAAEPLRDVCEYLTVRTK